MADVPDARSEGAFSVQQQSANQAQHPKPPTTPTPPGAHSGAPASSPLQHLASSPAPSSTRNGDNEISPAAFAALVARVAATEATLASLQAQVAQLASIVKGSAPPNALLSNLGGGGAGSRTSVFSPFDSPAPVPTSTMPTAASTSRTSPAPLDNSDLAVSALTQQVAALSTSVAQLQRLQSQNVSGPSFGGVLPPSPSGLGHNGMGHGPSLGMGRHMAPPPLDMINTSASAVGPHSASLLSPPPNIGLPRGGFNDGPRTPVNRSFGSSLLNDNMDNKWGAPSPVKYGGAGPNSAIGSGPGREWPSTGPGGPGGNNFNGMGAGGAAAPGAGIVVTKWEHLNLKVDLLRSISKYGIGPPNKIQARVLPFMLKGSDIIAQAPPTQERIISYVIPALQLCLTLPPLQGPYRGPVVIIITTTVDQATQCHKLVRNVGGPLGVRAALAAGAPGSSSLPNEVAAMQRDAIQILIGTPAKINEVVNARGGLSGSECRLLILDEVDQLIARNLYENVLSVARLLPAPRRLAGGGGPLTPGASPFSPVVGSPYDGGQHSPFNPQSKTPFPSSQPTRFSTPGPNGAPPSPTPMMIERQTCLFSNTIPTDVINFSQSLQVRDPVRVLVRREGSTNSQESVSSITPGINLKHTYVYLTITGSARSEDQSGDSGPGTIGSGRASSGSAASEEATRAKEYKLDTLVKMLDDYPLWQAIIHVGTYAMLEAVVYQLTSRNWDTLYLASDMPPGQKKAVLQQWRMSTPGAGPRFLVCFDVTPKPPDIPWSPLVINFDLPRSVEGYALRAAAAVPPAPRQGQPSPQFNGVIVSFVQAAGGDVEMLRSTECAYRFKSAEIPAVFHDLF